MSYKIGFAVTGSFCTLSKCLVAIDELIKKGYDITPILSYTVQRFDTRFFQADDFKREITSKTGKKFISTIQEAEPIGPKKLFDCLVVCPATGNTISKIANAVTDTPVTMAVKSHLRNNMAVVLSLSTNDGLSGSAVNIGKLLNRKNIYFVPFGQDDAVNKPCSLMADLSYLDDTIKSAIQGKQFQPLLS